MYFICLVGARRENLPIEAQIPVARDNTGVTLERRTFVASVRVSQELIARKWAILGQQQKNRNIFRLRLPVGICCIPLLLWRIEGIPVGHFHGDGKLFTNRNVLYIGS